MDLSLSFTNAKPQISPIFNKISNRIISTNFQYFRSQRQASIFLSHNHNAGDKSNQHGTFRLTYSNNVTQARALARAFGAFGFGLSGLTTMSPVKTVSARPNRGSWFSLISNCSDNCQDQECEPSNSLMEALRHFIKLYLASSPPPNFMISEDINELKKEALEQIKQGENIAIEKLETMRKEFLKNQEIQRQYNVEMALVEILLTQGEYKKASEDYKELLEGKYGISSDVRPSLYKAIIYTMLGNVDTKEIEKCWKEFIDVNDTSPYPGGPDQFGSNT